MFREITTFIGCGMMTRDGGLGSVEDAYFDDDGWALRYLVVRPDAVPGRRPVLVDPWALVPGELGRDVLGVNLTRAQIHSAPDVDTALPASRILESRIREHFGWPAAWGPLGLWSTGGYPALFGEVGGSGASRMDSNALTDEPRSSVEADIKQAMDSEVEHSHLRSWNEFKGYKVHGTDKDFGRVSDVLIDARTWRLEAVIVALHTWFPHSAVAIPPGEIASINWYTHALEVRVGQAELKGRPRFEDALSFERALRHPRPPSAS